jgi:hypothetical protein
VEGAGDEAVAAWVFVVSVLVAPLFLVTFFFVFFVVFAPVAVLAVELCSDFSVVAPVTGFVAVFGPVCVVVVCANATPNDKRATATRAEMVFFILFSNPLFLWPVRGLPTS